MKRVFRNWFASFATVFIVEMLYLSMAGQNSGVPSVHYALQDTLLFNIFHKKFRRENLWERELFLSL